MIYNCIIGHISSKIMARANLMNFKVWKMLGKILNFVYAVELGISSNSCVCVFVNKKVKLQSPNYFFSLIRQIVVLISFVWRRKL